MEYKIFESSDANVKKFVFEWGASGVTKKGIAEAVLYRYNSYAERTVICCSVQSGCPVGCTFCGTGKFFIRNLEAHEIVEQVVTVLNSIDCCTNEIKKFQIMFMSMGEPFLNFANLEEAIERLYEMYPNAQLLVSTSAPASIYKHMSEFVELSKRIPKVGLQFSVHESTDSARAKLIPTKTSTLRQIAAAGEFWAANVGRKPFFNYCVHEGNARLVDIDNLQETFNLDVWEVTLSVICEKDESVHSSIQRQLKLIESFNKKMISRGFSTRVFNPAGQDDIGGGCGQLWYFQDWNLVEQIESSILRARILITCETMKTPELRELVTTKQALESIYEGFKYFVVKIDTLYEALDNSELEEFFHILDIYNEYRKDCQDKEPSRYWVINREEVPKIETFEQFKSKLQK
jgi:23S rRNA (adenine2503-C2)-methyltransferase